MFKRKKENGQKKEKRDKEFVQVDFPQENELISHPDYSVRIKAGKASFVEVSIDGGEWLPCYNAAGYWWHDWYGYTTGEHSLAACIKDENGCIISSSNTRKCVCKF